MSVKMPFARSNETGIIVSIADVERGNKCNCRCLSCYTPVTARKGDENQWHFGHRTDEASTESECRFSPVTAIALIIRQQLPSLQSFDLDGFSFNNVQWEIDARLHGVQVDAYAQDPVSQHTVVIQIPFANANAIDLEELTSHVDSILSIDTRSIASALYEASGKPVLVSPEGLFNILLDNWEEWVTMLHPSTSFVSAS